MGYFCLTYLVTLILFTLYPVVKDVAIVVTVVDVDDDVRVHGDDDDDADDVDGEREEDLRE